MVLDDDEVHLQMVIGEVEILEVLEVLDYLDTDEDEVELDITLDVEKIDEVADISTQEIREIVMLITFDDDEDELETGDANEVTDVNEW